MNQNLASLIAAFQNAVAEAVALMEESGIARPLTNTAWVETEHQESGFLQNGVRYYKHGYGCSVHLPQGVVNFDFGANGEIDGFDCNRIILFAENHKSAFGSATKGEITRAYEHALQEGEIIASPYINHYVRNDA
ncbi:MAG: hypothetical protein ABL916_21205 [Burkholderiaceae bacterium]